MRTFKVSALIGLLLATLAIAADSITLRDGSRIEGRILSRSATQLYIVTSNTPGRHVQVKDIARFEWRGKTEVFGEVATRPAAEPIVVEAKIAATSKPATPNAVADPNLAASDSQQRRSKHPTSRPASDVDKSASTTTTTLPITSEVVTTAQPRPKPTTSPRKESRTTRRSPTLKWYEGGTLHKKSALEWQSATSDDKLATCADFVAALWQERKLKPSIQDSIKSVEDIKPYAIGLVVCLDAATEKDSNHQRNLSMYSNQTVSDLAIACIVLMELVD